MNKRKLVQFYKRAFLVFLCLIPFLVLLQYALGEQTSDFTKISLTVLLAGAVIGMVEWIRNNRIQK